MTFRQFRKTHRLEINAAIRRALGRGEEYAINDEERRLWCLNDEDLYRWARSEGAAI